MTTTARRAIERLADELNADRIPLFRPATDSGDLFVANADELLVRVSAHREDEIWVVAGHGLFNRIVVASDDSADNLMQFLKRRRLRSLTSIR